MIYLYYYKSGFFGFVMQILSLILLSLGLAADAFSVSLCKGLKIKKRQLLKNAVIIGLFFGGFQALMPLIGWLLGRRITGYIEKFDHFIAMGILSFIGIKMIIDAIRGKDDEENDKTDVKELLVLAVATSIDALAVGFTFAFDGGADIAQNVAMIGGITFAVCFGGVFLGSFFGNRFGKPASIAGGCVLILIGVKIMLEGIGVL